MEHCYGRYFICFVLDEEFLHAARGFAAFRGPCFFFSIYTCICSRNAHDILRHGHVYNLHKK